MSALSSMAPVGFTQTARRRLALLALVAAAIAVFMSAESLGEHPLWLDEAFTVHDSNRSIAQILRMTGDRGASVHPPLPYLVMQPFVATCGESEACLRAPAVASFAAAAFCIVLVAGRLFGWYAAWFATLLWPTLPYAIKYAQQARAYTLIAFLAAASLLLVTRVLALDGGPPAKRWAFAGLGASLGLLASTHLLAGLWIGGVVVWCGVARARQNPDQRSRLRLWWVAAAMFGLTAWPGIVGASTSLLTAGNEHLGSQWGIASAYWRLALGVFTLGTFARAVPLLIIAAVTSAALRRRFSPWVILGLAALPLVLFAVRRPTHFVTVRHLMPSVVAVVVLACGGFAALVAAPRDLFARRLGTRHPRLLLGLGLLTAAVPAFALLSGAAQARRARATAGSFEPWDEAAQWIAERTDPESAVVAVPASITPYPLEVYSVGAPVVPGRVAAVEKALDASPPRIVLVWSHVTGRRREKHLHRLQSMITSADYRPGEHASFGASTIVVKVYDRPSER